MTHLPTTTCARLLRALAREQILERVDDKYHVGLRVLAWSSSATAGSDLIQAATPVLKQLCDETGETTSIFVRNGDIRICVATIEATQSVIYRGRIGQTMPLHAGAPGKVMMAYDPTAIPAAHRRGLTRFTASTITTTPALEHELQTVRTQGYSSAHEEREPNLSSLAAPVFGPDGNLIATVSIGAPAARLTPQDAPRIAPTVMAAAQHLSTKIRSHSHASSTIASLSSASVKPHKEVDKGNLVHATSPLHEISTEPE